MMETGYSDAWRKTGTSQQCPGVVVCLPAECGVLWPVLDLVDISFEFCGGSAGVGESAEACG